MRAYPCYAREQVVAEAVGEFGKGVSIEWGNHQHIRPIPKINMHDWITHMAERLQWSSGYEQYDHVG